MHGLIHMIVSAVVHGAIYDMIFHATRHMPTIEVLEIGGGLLLLAGVIWLVFR